ncbi:MAG: type II and III secretion system protein family protein [Pseudomonadota bacterium]
MKRALFTAAMAVGLTAFAPVFDASKPAHLGSGLMSSAAHAESLIRLRDDGGASLQNINLGLNKSLVIDLPRDAHDLLVASPKVADAVIRTKRRIYVFGKSVGETNIFAFDKAGAPILSLNLNIERDIAGIKEQLARFIPGSKINVELISDNVILTGQVQTPQDAERAVALAQAFIKGGEATTGAFTQTATSSGNTGAGGFAGSSVAIAQPEARRESQIINLLKIAAEDQVTLKVTIAEVQRSVMKQMGFSGQFSAGNGGMAFRVGKGFSSGLGNQQGTGSISAGGSIGDFGFDANLHAFERAGVARTLAEPTLTAISGKAASFKVGGSYFVGGGRERAIEEFNGVDREVFTDTFTEKEYGIGLNFTPVVLAPGRISIEMSTEVSEPDIQGAANDGVGGIFAGMRKREASTTVELPSGGSLMVAGLVQDSVRQSITKIPGLGNLPILGTLFRSRDFQRDETELVIIVTPYLVRPVANHKLQRPDNNFQATSDINANLLGRITKVYGRQTPAGSRYNGKIGFIIQ